MPTEIVVNLWALSDLCTPWCLHVVATQRIAEHIAAGKSQIDDLAAAAGCDSYALHRALTHLVGKGVFEESPPGHFALNEAARVLLDPSSHLGLDLEGIGGRMAHAWGTLLTYVRTGEPGYRERFGMSFWEDLDAHPSVGASFDALIGPPGHGTPKADIEINGGWDSVRRVVDVGGGTGAMLAQLLQKWRHLTGTLVDLPRTVALADEIFHAAGVSDRVTAVGQSFFDALPASADVYLLKGVINDWPDREATDILTRCAEAARPDGRVLILGGTVPEDAPRGLEIEMVLLGGKLRTITEMQELTRAARLEVLTAQRQASGRFVFECRPI
jgi:2,7-dihydroxy-5-methyl-1-naphthoate 7-O-methyltransferase